MRYLHERWRSGPASWPGNSRARWSQRRSIRRESRDTGESAPGRARIPSSLREAASRGLDTLIVGEGPHHTAIEAAELGIVVLYAGHYATETLGVRALGDEAAAHFGLSSTFIDVPSGL